MSKRVLVIATSLRKGSNSEILADAFVKGAVEAGHQVEKVVLLDKTIEFCRGCLACQKTGHCVIDDDMDYICKKMQEADVIAFATPVYFYEMCGQMKTLLDRSNPLFPSDYAFRKIYLLASAAAENPSAIDGTINGLQGWIDCFDKVSLGGVLRGIGLTAPLDANQHKDLLAEAHRMGNSI